MPELPEVETVRRQLAEQIVGAKIKSAWARLERITHPDIETFETTLRGARLLDVCRRGKQLYFALDNQWYLLVHLGMTGMLQVRIDLKQVGPDVLPKHIHGVISFTDGRRLVFADPRTFGSLAVSRDLPFLKTMGPEPLEADFDEAALVARLASRTVKIKAALLDQKLVAGLGNIYADEVCFLARVHPAQRACDVSKVKLKALVGAIRPVLERAIAARGATLKDGGYQDTFGQSGEYRPLAYGQTGRPCSRCGTPIQRGVLGEGGSGRSYHFCPHCQPLKPPKRKKL